MNFDLWLKGCEINNTKIYPLEGSGDTAIYKVWSEYECNNNHYSSISSGLTGILANLQTAYALFNRKD